ITEQIGGQKNGHQVDLQTGNFLLGLGIFCRNGDTNKSPADNLLNNIVLKVNSQTTIQGPVSLKDLQDDNVQRYGLSDSLALAKLASTIASEADAHPLKGFAFMNLIRNGDWNTAINTSRASGVDTCKLEF